MFIIGALLVIVGVIMGHRTVRHGGPVHEVGVWVGILGIVLIVVSAFL